MVSTLAEPDLIKLMTHMAIVDCVNQVAIAADTHQWEMLRACFADQVWLDYSSLVGGEAGLVAADDLIHVWRQGLSQYEATQHLMGNHVVTIVGDTATCMVYVQATHWLPANADDLTWTVNGYYDYALIYRDDRWLITHSTFHAQMVRGSHRLLELAGVDLARWHFS